MGLPLTIFESSLTCPFFEGGNRQNSLPLEIRTLSWAGLWTLSYMPSMNGNNIPVENQTPGGKSPRART